MIIILMIDEEYDDRDHEYDDHDHTVIIIRDHHAGDHDREY